MFVSVIGLSLSAGDTLTCCYSQLFFLDSFLVIRYDCPATSNLMAWRQHLGMRQICVLESGGPRVNPYPVTHCDSCRHLTGAETVPGEVLGGSWPQAHAEMRTRITPAWTMMAASEKCMLLEKGLIKYGIWNDGKVHISQEERSSTSWKKLRILVGGWKSHWMWCWPNQNLCKINTQDRAFVWVKGRGREVRREDKKQSKKKKKPKSEAHAEFCDWFSSMHCQKVTWKGQLHRADVRTE